MALTAKHGLLGDGRIRVDGERCRVRRDTGGWYVVEDPSPWGDARVLYREMQDLVAIQWAGAILRIPFATGTGTFEWDGRGYRIEDMTAGEIRVLQDERPVVHGRVTVNGVHLDTVATELLPIIRPLAWALVLRSEIVARANRGSGA